MEAEMSVDAGTVLSVCVVENAGLWLALMAGLGLSVLIFSAGYSLSRLTHAPSHRVNITAGAAAPSNRRCVTFAIPIGEAERFPGGAYGEECDVPTGLVEHASLPSVVLDEEALIASSETTIYRAPSALVAPVGPVDERTRSLEIDEATRALLVSGVAR
jgi:hypothetical protein